MTKSNKTFSLFTISEARNVIFGLATLWIGLFHSDYLTLANYTDNRVLIKLFVYFRDSGNTGVDMFLFLSGIGLFFSFSKDSRLRSFWRKRYQRVLPTAFFIATIYFTWRCIRGFDTEGLAAYLSRITFTYFYISGERVFWFISLIIVLYLLFPVFYRVIERFRLKGTLLLIAGTVAFTLLLRWALPGVYDNVEIALCRVPVFIFGIWCGRFVMEKREISRKWLWAALGIAVAMAVLVYFYMDLLELLVSGYTKDMKTHWLFLYRYAEGVYGVMLVVLDAFVITWLRRRGRFRIARNFLEFVGRYSMEYYMIYLNFAHYLETVFSVEPYQETMLYFGSFVISLALCAGVTKFCDFFMAQMQKKPKDYLEKKKA